MTDAPDIAAPLAERPPFDSVEDEAEEQEGPSELIGEVLAVAAEAGFGGADFLELALACCAEIAADLTDGLEADEIGADPITVATLERLQIASQILAGVDFGEDPEGEDEGGLEAA